MDNKNNRKTLAILTLFLTGVCLISCGLIYQLLTQQCILWTCAPSRTFTIYDLILPADLYPSNAIINSMISFPESPGADSGVLNIYWEENESIYKSIFTVNKFGTIDRAVNYFDTVIIRRSRDSYRSHPDITYRSQIANEYEIGCGISSLGGEYECDLDARYEEFVISLNASITEQMPEKRFQEIVISLDRQFEIYLTQ
ncbi:MAG: hypothetical protein GY805_22000 [Chloroflexi bacterium]|nr:hypothetical protein [Chloroflexota bacterium]